MALFELRGVAAFTCAVFTSACAAPTPEQESPAPPDALVPYKPGEEVVGRLVSNGSDTLNNMMALWMEAFRRVHPRVIVEMEEKGSSRATPALIEGSAQLGPLSRWPKEAEQDRFEKTFGYKATVLSVAMDALAVYVHKDNPLDEITLEQVDAIFSKDRKRGYPEDIRTWGQLGLKGDWIDRPISRYGRNSASGTYGFFKEAALKGGDYKDTNKEMAGSASVVQAVTEDRYGIGYSGIGYATRHVKKLRIAENAAAKFVAAEAENLYNDTYPLRRFLYMAINKVPDKPLTPLVREFCCFMLSEEGQVIVEKDGYYPLTASIARGERKKLGIEK